MDSLDDWKTCVVTQGLLEGGQIWECGRYVFQIEQIRSIYKIAMFISKDEALKYVGLAEYSDEESLLDLLDIMNMKPTSKILMLRRP